MGIPFPHLDKFPLSRTNPSKDVYVDFVHENGGILPFYLYNIALWHVSPQTRASLHSRKRTRAKELGFRCRGTQGVDNDRGEPTGSYR